MKYYIWYSNWEDGETHDMSDEEIEGYQHGWCVDDIAYPSKKDAWMQCKQIAKHEILDLWWEVKADYNDDYDNWNGNEPFDEEKLNYVKQYTTINNKLLIINYSLGDGYNTMEWKVIDENEYNSLVNSTYENDEDDLYESIMKDVSKTIKKHLNEATYNNHEKDEQRIQSIIDKSKGDSLKMILYAFRMAKSIKDPVKLPASYEAAVNLLEDDHIVTKCFNAVLNDEVIDEGFFTDMSEDVQDNYIDALQNFAKKKHAKDKEYFEIIDREFVRYSPDVVFTDDIMLSERFPGEFAVKTDAGMRARAIRNGFNEYIDTDVFDEEWLELLYNYVSGWNRDTLNSVISGGYTKDDFEDEENFYEMPVAYQKAFTK